MCYTHRERLTIAVVLPPLIEINLTWILSHYAVVETLLVAYRAYRIQRLAHISMLSFLIRKFNIAYTAVVQSSRSTMCTIHDNPPDPILLPSRKQNNQKKKSKTIQTDFSVRLPLGKFKCSGIIPFKVGDNNPSKMAGFLLVHYTHITLYALLGFFDFL